LQKPPLKGRGMSGKKQKKLRRRVKEKMEKHGLDPLTFRSRLKVIKKAVKMGVITNLLLMSTNLVFADKLIVPYDCYPKEMQAEFAKTGRKLDLSGNDRTKNSWGFIVNEGSQFIIYTYKGATQDDFSAIMGIVQGE